MDYIVHILPNMFSGLAVSAKIFVLTFVLALPIGILLAMVRISHVVIFRKLAAMYIYLMRVTRMRSFMARMYTRDVSFRRVMVSLPRGGMTRLITWGRMMCHMVWR